MKILSILALATLVVAVSTMNYTSFTRLNETDLLQANIEALARGESETGVAEAMISVTRGSETIENVKGEKVTLAYTRYTTSACIGNGEVYCVSGQTVTVYD